MTININAYAQTTVRGALDLQISNNGVISGIISSNSSDTFKAGDAVKIDTAITVAGMIQFIKAAAGDVAFGYIVENSQKNSGIVAEDKVQVAGMFGPVMVMVAEATITPGAKVEQNDDGNVQTLASGSPRGIALDYATAGQTLRVMILAPITPL